MCEQLRAGEVVGALYVFKMRRRPSAGDEARAQAALEAQLWDLTLCMHPDFLKKTAILDGLSFQEAARREVKKKHRSAYMKLLYRLEQLGVIQRGQRVRDFLGFVTRLNHIGRRTASNLDRALADLTAASTKWLGQRGLVTAARAGLGPGPDGKRRRLSAANALVLRGGPDGDTASDSDTDTASDSDSDSDSDSNSSTSSSDSDTSSGSDSDTPCVVPLVCV